MNKSTITIKHCMFTDILFQSFRYCLGRRSCAVSNCTERLQQYWGEFKPWEQKKIQEEITWAIEMNWAGDTCDIARWNEILNLEVEKI